MQTVELFTIPPNFEEICAAFPLAKGSTILFAYAPDIYNPNNVSIAPDLIAHERVHIERQGDDPEGWWEQYIADPDFRLEEERLAHIAEAWYLVRASTNNRAARKRIAVYVGSRLASPLYNMGLTRSHGISLLRQGLKR